MKLRRSKSHPPLANAGPISTSEKNIFKRGNLQATAFCFGSFSFDLKRSGTGEKDNRVDTQISEEGGSEACQSSYSPSARGEMEG